MDLERKGGRVERTSYVTTQFPSDDVRQHIRAIGGLGWVAVRHCVGVRSEPERAGVTRRGIVAGVGRRVGKGFEGGGRREKTSSVQEFA